MSEEETIIILESLNFKQALKYLLQKEKHRHVLDILKMDETLRKLKDVELPEDLDLDLWIDV
jgi:hypothetical protein